MIYIDKIVISKATMDEKIKLKVAVVKISDIF